jgi:hypothetical protein
MRPYKAVASETAEVSVTEMGATKMGATKVTAEAVATAETAEMATAEAVATAETAEMATEAATTKPSECRRTRYHDCQEDNCCGTNSAVHDGNSLHALNTTFQAKPSLGRYKINRHCSHPR